jgi:large subunit ribosomal protein L3
MKGILGRKIGMTQVFTKSGELVPVTVVSVEPNVVTQIKTTETDGYNAVQLGFDTKRAKLATKASIGHTNKANTTPKRFFREIRGVDVNNYSLGQEVKADIFTEGEVIDVTGTTKGKGFQGNIKRHGYSRGPMGHGSQYHRGVGSLGSRLPKRVFKGKKLPGHMGTLTVTIQNLEIISVDTVNNVLLVKGNIPGAKQSLVMIRTAVKNPGVINEFEGLISYDQALVETYDEVVAENPELVEETPMVEENALEESTESQEA